MDKTFSIVVAMDQERGIGKNGILPWHLPPDLKHFKEVTTVVSIPDKVNAVIMGRKTWESLPEKFRPLPGRVNVVLTSNKDIKFPPDVLVFNSFDEALNVLSWNKQVGEIFVIGGAQLFTKIITHPKCAKLYTTLIQGSFSCDAIFPPIPDRFKEINRTPVAIDSGLSYCFSDLISR